jgi:hypothetical protein
MTDRVAVSLLFAVIGLALAAVGGIGVIKTRRVEPLTWGNTQADAARILLGVLICASVIMVTINKAYRWWWASLVGLFVTAMTYHYIRYGTEAKPDTMSGVLSGAGLSVAAAAPLGCAVEGLIAIVAFIIVGLGVAIFQLLFG